MMNTPRAPWAVSELRKRVSQKPFNGNPHTRLSAPIRLQSVIWAEHVFDSRQQRSRPVERTRFFRLKAISSYQFALEARMIPSCRTARRFMLSKLFFIRRLACSLPLA